MKAYNCMLMNMCWVSSEISESFLIAQWCMRHCAMIFCSNKGNSEQTDRFVIKNVFFRMLVCKNPLSGKKIKSLI